MEKAHLGEAWVWRQGTWKLGHPLLLTHCVITGQPSTLTGMVFTTGKGRVTSCTEKRSQLEPQGSLSSIRYLLSSCYEMHRSHGYELMHHSHEKFITGDQGGTRICSIFILRSITNHDLDSLDIIAWNIPPNFIYWSPNTQNFRM